MRLVEIDHHFGLVWSSSFCFPSCTLQRLKQLGVRCLHSSKYCFPIHNKQLFIVLSVWDDSPWKVKLTRNIILVSWSFAETTKEGCSTRFPLNLPEAMIAMSDTTTTSFVNCVNPLMVRNNLSAPFPSLQPMEQVFPAISWVSYHLSSSVSTDQWRLYKLVRTGLSPCERLCSQLLKSLLRVTLEPLLLYCQINA